MILDKIASFLEKFWHWLVRSSEDPTKMSLAVKGAIGAAAATIIGALGAFHYQVPGLSDMLNTLLDQLVIITKSVLQVVAAVSIAIGVIRKIKNSIFGKKPTVE